MRCSNTVYAGRGPEKRTWGYVRTAKAQTNLRVRILVWGLAVRQWNIWIVHDVMAYIDDPHSLVWVLASQLDTEMPFPGSQLLSKH